MWLYRRKVRDVLRKARAWQRLQSQGQDVAHYRLFQDIPFGTDLGLPANAFFGLVPPAFRADAETCLKQVMYSPARDSGLWAELICHLAGDTRPVALPGPTPWRAALAEQGVPISTWRSRLGFFVLQFNAMKEGLGALKRLVRHWRSGDKIDGAPPYVLFPGVRDHYLPSLEPRKDQRWDLISWYRRSSVRDPRTTEIRVTSFDDLSGNDLSGIRQVDVPLPGLSGTEWPRFIFRAVLMIFWASMRWVTGAWWTPFILPQAIYLAYARHLSVNRLPLQACFNSTQKIVRPLWTYDAERRGTRVMIILYSKNVSVFIPSNPQVPDTAPDFAQVSWPEFVIWDNDHERELVATGVNPKARFTKVGLIGLADSPRDFAALPHPSVAVFDVDAVSITYGALRGFARPYWNHENTLAFVEGAFRAIRAAGALPVYKPKGYLGGKLLRPRPQAFLDLVERYDAVLLDGMINANRVITATDASISMPFTSTAASSAYLARPSVYFDPTADLQNHLALAGDVSVLFDVAELEEWVRTALADIPSERNQRETERNV